MTQTYYYHQYTYQQKGVKTLSQNTEKQFTNYMSFIKNTMKPIKLSRGDIDEDLNEPTSTKHTLYLRDFINECCLKHDNKATLLLTH